MDLREVITRAADMYELAWTLTYKDRRENALELAATEVFSIRQIVGITGVSETWAYENITRPSREGGSLNPDHLRRLLEIEGLEGDLLRACAVELVNDGTSAMMLEKLTPLRRRTINHWLKRARDEKENS